MFAPEERDFGVNKGSGVLELSSWAIFKSNLSQTLTSYMIESEIRGQILFSFILLKPIEINVRLDLCHREDLGYCLQEIRTGPIL